MSCVFRVWCRHTLPRPSLQCFGVKYVELDRERTGGSLYLHITARKVAKEVAPDAPAAPITKLAIGVEGGFQTEDSKYTIETSYELVQFPGPVTQP